MVIRRKFIIKSALCMLYVACILLVAKKIISISYSEEKFTDYPPSIDVNPKYEKWIENYESEIVPGLGENGKPGYLYGKEKLLAQKIQKIKAINILLSNKISLNRKLPDVRDELCANVTYDGTLPSASVVIIFFNEPLSILLRTIVSVLEGSPNEILKEIILVDDSSDEEELKEKLDYYVSVRLLKKKNKIKIIRLPERLGLIRARLAGAEQATGDVLVFLDAHCEVIVQWLEPLLQRIKEKNDAVLMPIIDNISDETLEYSHDNDPSFFQVGGFTWSGHFTWINIQENEIRNRKSRISPINSPTMAGGLFAIDRNYFWKIGSYDSKMDGWGGENLEMSFRIWQCGGSLETIPCSRVGHIFRNFHPYKFPNDKDTHGINTARLVHVWMDDYKRLFLLHRDEFRDNIDEKIGDLTERKELRKKLDCKSFKWYLENVYPEKFIPDENVIAYGRVKLKNSNLCLDNLQREESKPYNLGVYGCHSKLFPSQLFSLSNAGELRRDETCAVVRLEDISARRSVVKMIECDYRAEENEWMLTENGNLVHVSTGLCLDGTDIQQDADVFVKPCDSTSSQSWQFDYNANSLGVLEN